MKSPVFLAATHSWWVTVKPVTTIDQRATSVYYEPEFKSVVQRYKQILQSKDEDKLQEFVDERRELTIRRLNVSPRFTTYLPCSAHYDNSVQLCGHRMGVEETRATRTRRP